jgi:photosystem II stability/assembly factor-like uncharacterized protein
VWAGGLGGVARFSDGERWSPPSSKIALHSVTALEYRNGCLLAGHESGIARSADGGKSWAEADIGGSVSATSAIALSPQFAEDGVGLAATFGTGVLRTADSGRSWRSSNFGLDEREVMALAWLSNESVVAGTKSGLFHSPNGGRAWRPVPNTSIISFSALTALRDGGLLAAPTSGRPLQFSPDLTERQAAEALPEGIQVWALATLPDGTVLLGSGNHGLWASASSAQDWTQLWQREIWSLAITGERVFGGTNDGLASSDDRGRTWTVLPAPPLHHVHWLLPLDDALVLAGVHTRPVLRFPSGQWASDDTVPSPLIGLWKSGPRSFIFSAGNGLYQYELGKAWERVADECGCVWATFLGNEGWAGIASGSGLLRTRDGGRTWDHIRSPFGNLKLAALQAFPTAGGTRSISLMAATYDERARSVKVWRSDDGERWTPGADSYTLWPQVATLGEPPLITIGNVISTRQPDGTWDRVTVGGTAFRRVVSHGSDLIALAIDSIWRSDDMGKSWRRDDEGLPASELLDIAVFEDKLHVLLTGGRLLASVA